MATAALGTHTTAVVVTASIGGLCLLLFKGIFSAASSSPPPLIPSTHLTRGFPDYFLRLLMRCKGGILIGEENKLFNSKVNRTGGPTQRKEQNNRHVTLNNQHS